jgi:predicted DNA-binding protein YlxM (UPF0122 family)
MLFTSGIQKVFSQSIFHQLPKQGQNVVLQDLYDARYSVPEISNFVGMPSATIYDRINAHRGRGRHPSSC